MSLLKVKEKYNILRTITNKTSNMDNIITDLIKGNPNILQTVYTDLAQPSVQAIGKSLGTVFEFCTSFLLPVKLLNEKFKLNFQKRLNEYEKKLEEIPEDKRCEVHPQIGVPIIEQLSYTTNDEIADLFTTLLATASNIDMAEKAHPGFINMIGRLSPDEAHIITYLKDKIEIPYCEFRGITGKGAGYITLMSHVTLIPDQVKLDFLTNINAYIDNLISLGILTDLPGTHHVDDTTYNQIKEVYQLEEYQKQFVPSKFVAVTVNKGLLRITDLGRLFIDACTKSTNPI